MANWCRNEVHFATTREQRLKDIPLVLEFIGGYGVIDFERIAPTPQEYDKKPNHADRWRMENWGTEMNAEAGVWIPQQQTLYFETIRSPAVPIVSTIHKRFPQLHIDYEYYNRGPEMIGGCEFLPKEEWDEGDFYYLIDGKEHKSSSWEAGRAYNPWSMEYQGFKGFYIQGMYD